MRPVMHSGRPPGPMSMGYFQKDSNKVTWRHSTGTLSLNIKTTKVYLHFEKGGQLHSDAHSKARILSEQFRSVFTRDNTQSSAKSLAGPAHRPAEPLTINEDGSQKLTESLRMGWITSVHPRSPSNRGSPSPDLPLLAGYQDRGNSIPVEKGIDYPRLQERGSSWCSKLLSHLSHIHSLQAPARMSLRWQGSDSFPGQVCSSSLCMVQCTHMMTTDGTLHLYNRGSSMLVNSLHSGENNM